MFRKVVTASVLGFLLAGTVISAPANAAAIGNGTKCTTKNATTKVSGYVYKCTYDPQVKTTKLTWISQDCLNAAATYTKLNSGYLAAVQNLPATLAALDAQIAAAQQKVADSNTKADALDAQVATWKTKLATFTAARDALVADTKNATKNATAITTYTTAIRSLNSAINSNMTASASLRKIGNTVSTMQAQRAATITSVSQTKSGVAQALSMRKLVCQKGL